MGAEGSTAKNDAKTSTATSGLLARRQNSHGGNTESGAASGLLARRQHFARLANFGAANSTTSNSIAPASHNAATTCEQTATSSSGPAIPHRSYFQRTSSSSSSSTADVHAASDSEKKIRDRGMTLPDEAVRKKRSMRTLRCAVQKWTQRDRATQFFAVVRHAERADGWNGFVDGERWTQTPDFEQWPLDPPLSDDGLHAAWQIGKLLSVKSESLNSPVHIVVSSPYWRCVQTAVQICCELGPDVRLLVDHSLGEVFGPCVFGTTKPEGHIRATAYIRRYCSHHNVKCEQKVLGIWPQWPETLPVARRRFADRFLEYLHRGSMAKRNFIIVTHADGVGATLKVMPSQIDQIVQQIDYGGMFLAFRGCLPYGSTEALDGPAAASSIAKAMIGYSNEDNDVSDDDHDAERKPTPQLPKKSDGWNVETHDIRLSRKGSPKNIGVKSRITLLVKRNRRFSQEQIEELLGGMERHPLGGTAESEHDTDGLDRLLRPSISSKQSAGSTPKSPARDGFGRQVTLISDSTYVFGGSDYACDSEMDELSPRWSEAATLSPKRSRRHSRTSRSSTPLLMDRHTLDEIPCKRQNTPSSRTACTRPDLPKLDDPSGEDAEFQLPGQSQRLREISKGSSEDDAPQLPDMEMEVRPEVAVTHITSEQIEKKRASLERTSSTDSDATVS